MTPCHTDPRFPDYHPRERYVFHDRDECGYGQTIKRDGNAVDGKRLDPLASEREL